MEINLSDDFIRIINEKFKKILTKYKKYLWGKKYRELNKQKIQLKKKIYSENNKEKISIASKIYRKNNVEKLAQYEKSRSERKKNLYEQNKESYLAKVKIYQQTDKSKKCSRIRAWKRIGLISEDYDALYEKVYNTTNCEECNVLLTVNRIMTNTTLCMDHDHTTGLFRNVLCVSCNVKRG